MDGWDGMAASRHRRSRLARTRTRSHLHLHLQTTPTLFSVPPTRSLLLRRQCHIPPASPFEPTATPGSPRQLRSFDDPKCDDALLSSGTLARVKPGTIYELCECESKPRIYCAGPFSFGPSARLPRTGPFKPARTQRAPPPSRRTVREGSRVARCDKGARRQHTWQAGNGSGTARRTPETVSPLPPTVAV